MKIRKIQQRSVYFEMFEFDWMLVDSSSEFYILVNGQEIEAAIALTEIEGSIHIVLIEVRKKYIGQKKGSMLISFACREAIKRGINVVTLDSKTNLVDYYKRIGAKILFGERMFLEGVYLEEMAKQNKGEKE